MTQMTHVTQVTLRQPVRARSRHDSGTVPGSPHVRRAEHGHAGDMLRCVIVDDSPGFIDVARTLLEREGASVVGIAETSEAALRRVVELQPDVTLLDVNLAGESGFELARRLVHEAGVDPGRIVMVSTQSADDLADLVDDAPVAGFVPKHALSLARIQELTASSGR